ncbi:hypothetical protein BN1708_016211, partial [Verticillium longisporum]
ENNFENPLTSSFGGALRLSADLTSIREGQIYTKEPVTSERDIAGVVASARRYRYTSPEVEQIASSPRPPSPAMQSSWRAGLTNSLTSYEPYNPGSTKAYFQQPYSNGLPSHNCIHSGVNCPGYPLQEGTCQRAQVQRTSAIPLGPKDFSCVPLDPYIDPKLRPLLPTPTNPLSSRVNGQEVPQQAGIGNRKGYENAMGAIASHQNARTSHATDRSQTSKISVLFYPTCNLPQQESPAAHTQSVNKLDRGIRDLTRETFYLCPI